MTDKLIQSQDHYVMPFIEFLRSYSTEEPCSNCLSWEWAYTQDEPCHCSSMYLLQRIRVYFDEKITRESKYHVVIENNSRIISTNYKIPPSYRNISEIFDTKGDSAILFDITRSIPDTETSHQFNILLDLEQNADDELTIFESHVDFLNHMFGQHLKKLKAEIMSKIRVKKNYCVDAKDPIIIKCKKDFFANALSMCCYERPDQAKHHHKVVSLFLDKLFQVLYAHNITSLLPVPLKENPHMSKRKKTTKKDL